MDDNQITPEFIESMVDKVVDAITEKLEELDVSMDYLAAALLDTDALAIAGSQAARGRAAVRDKRK